MRVSSTRFAPSSLPGTVVYVAHPPGVPIDDIVKLAGQVQKLGLKATAAHHRAQAREPRAARSRACALRGARHGQCAVRGGRHHGREARVRQQPRGAGDGTIQQVRLPRDRRRRLIRKAARRSARSASSRRCAARRRSRRRPTSRCISRRSSASIRRRSSTGKPATNAKGITLPIHVGMPGPASLRQLAKFAMLCGVGASMRMLTTRTGAMANLLSTQAPDEMVTAIARHRAAASRIAPPEDSFLCLRRRRQDGALGECGALGAVRLEQPGDWLPR